MILHQAAMGTGCFACRKSYNCSYQVYILIREKNYISSQILPEDYRFQLPFEKVLCGSLKLFQAWSSPQGRSRNGTSVGVSWLLPFCSRGRLTFSSARQTGKHFASSNIKKKNPKLGKLCCQTALGTQLSPLCKYSWRKESRNTEKMEQALDPEDTLSCCLVLSTATPAGTQALSWAGFNYQGPHSKTTTASLT